MKAFVAGGLVAAGTGAATVTPQPSSAQVVTPFVGWASFTHEGNLAVESDGFLWVLSNGNVREIPVGGATQPLFSADGKWLSFTVSTDCSSGSCRATELWIAHGDGSDARPITGARIASADRIFGWSPQTDELAIAASPESTRAPFDQPTTLRIISPGGADRIVVTAPDIVGASWSPTGAALAVSTMSTRGIDTLSVYGLDGGAPRKWFVASHDTWIVPDGWWTGRGIGFITVDDGAVPDGSGGTTGGPFYRLAAPGRSPARIGATMIDTGDGGPVATAGGALAYSDNGHLAEGDPRYAWGGKQVEVCPQGSVRCTEVPAPARTSTIDPSWSPTGSTLAYVEATETADPEAPSSIVKAWYGSHRLFLLDVARGSSREVPAAIGVTDEEWSSDGASMLYEADDAMWWLSSLTSTPVKIEAPILPTATWASSSYYGQIDWQDEFAWSAGRRAEPCYYVCGFGTARR